MAGVKLKCASVNIVKFAEKQMKTTLPKRPNWEEVFQVMCKDLTFNMYTKCKRNGDITICSISKDGKSLCDFEWQNEVVFFSNEGDWDWNFIYKEILNWIFKNKRKVYGKK